MLVHVAGERCLDLPETRVVAFSSARRGRRGGVTFCDRGVWLGSRKKQKKKKQKTKKKNYSHNDQTERNIPII